MVLAELVKRIRISADSNCIHAYVIKSVDVNRTTIAQCTGTATSQPDEGLYT